MKKLNNILILTREDHAIIMSYIRLGSRTIAFNRQDVEHLENEVKNARLVDAHELPDDIVRLNSTVIIKDEKENKIMELTVVTPDKANIREKKISIMSPIGTALIGYRKGQQVQWQVPAGTRKFTIIDVHYKMFTDAQ